MNHGQERQFTRLELKYCERCGELWVRQQGTAEVRCRRCVGEEEELATRWRARSHPERPVKLPCGPPRPAAADRVQGSYAGTFGRNSTAMGGDREHSVGEAL